MTDPTREPSEQEVEAAVKGYVAELSRYSPDGALPTRADCIRAALTAAAQVRAADQNLIAEIDRLRRLLKSIQGHPNTHALISGVIQNELDRPPEKPALMPIYGATEPDDGPDVLGLRKDVIE